MRQRKEQCAAYRHAHINVARAEAEIPASGVPSALQATLQEIEGSEKAPTQLSGPASRAPEHGPEADVGEASENDSEISDSASDATEDACQPCLADANANVATACIAVDPVHDLAPVKMMQALQGQVQVLHDQAEKIAKTENTARVCDKDGVFQPVSDEGGRHEYKNIVLDMQSILKNIDRQSEVKLQNAAAGSERCIVVCPDALAVPTNGPLNAYDARTYPISSVHWWFGDGAPNLDRDRKMLFEEVARMLLDREELEYHLVEDEDKYIARSPGRFTEPEVCAMLGDAVRRLALLQGVRGTMQRKGFWQDLKAVAEASTEDFMIAQNIATPGESLGSAASRSDMPAKVRTALRSLLISTANVFGTEGRKQSLRHEMHAANLLFGAGTFFTTPNHADTYSPLMLLLHRGPSSNDHLAINASENHDSPKQDTSALDILSETPTMPSLEAMHEISAKNPRAQARFYLLMQELHFKFVHGFDTLRIGRKTFCKPGIRVVRHDWYASNL